MSKKKVKEDIDLSLKHVTKKGAYYNPPAPKVSKKKAKKASKTEKEDKEDADSETKDSHKTDE